MNAGRRCLSNAPGPRTTRRPRAATSKSGWWWPYLSLRTAYLRLERLFRDGFLFRFFDPGLSEHGAIARDSNLIEGALNASLKLMLSNHRGLPENTWNDHAGSGIAT